MASFTHLNGYEVEDAQSRNDISNLYVSNIGEMKSLNDLSDGDVVKTLGYYESNDGGSGLYLIRTKTETDVEDGGFIHFIGDELVAELILNNSIDIKQFGAKGDGETDDTQAFKNLYKFISDKIGNNFFTSNSYVALLTPGKYLITEKIEIPIYIKTKIEGNVLLLSNVSNGSTIKYTSNGKVAPTGLRALSNGSFNDGEIISGTGILVIQRNNGDLDINNNTGTIGLEIGDTEINDYMNLSRCKFNNITILGFEKALQLNMNDVYLITFNNLHTENDKYGVYINNHIDNAGENISFNNCIFSHHYNAVFINSAQLTGLNFEQCSFDFNGNHILLNKEGNVLVNCKSCHFEGVGFVDSVIQATTENTPGFGYIAYRNSDNVYSTPTLVLNDCYLHLNTGNPANHLFGAKYANHYLKHFNVILKNHILSFDKNKLTFDNRYMTDENVNFQSTLYNQADNMLVYAGSSIDKYGRFNFIPNDLTGSVLDSEFKNTLNNLGYKINGNNWSSLALNVSVDTEDKIFEKSIKVEQLANNTYLGLVKEVYNLSGEFITAIGYIKEDNLTLADSSITDYKLLPQLIIRFYDEYNNQLDTYTHFTRNLFQEKDGWICLGSYRKIPANAVKCEVFMNGVVEDNNQARLTFKGSLKFGGIITEIKN